MRHDFRDLMMDNVWDYFWGNARTVRGHSNNLTPLLAPEAFAVASYRRLFSEIKTLNQ